MNGILQVTTLLTSAEELLDSQQLFALLAQTAPPPTGDPLARTGAAVESGVDYMQDLGRSLIAFIPNLLAAVLILALGLIIAAIAKSVVRAILNRTDIDNKIAGALMGRSSTGLPKVENLIANIVFWIVVLFTAIAVLQALQLEAVYPCHQSASHQQCCQN